MVAERNNLDTDLQMLVFKNYNKFISTIDTIRRYKEIEDKGNEDKARHRNWIEQEWAPWEEILTPKADFMRKSLNKGKEVPLRSPEAIEAFKMLNPNYRKKKREDMRLIEEEFYAKQFEIKGDIPEPLMMTWARPLVVRLVPPHDWAPRGWHVDQEELAFIREEH
ncbi:hypothetical protein JHK87_006544 [Glycine soja]|nr:hypothetical protein JHK87_006544 [Glycine soja]